MFLPAKFSLFFAASSSYQSCRSQKPDYPFSSNFSDRTKESPRICLQIAARRLLIILLSVHVFGSRLNIQNRLRNFIQTLVFSNWKWTQNRRTIRTRSRWFKKRHAGMKIFVFGDNALMTYCCSFFRDRRIRLLPKTCFPRRVIKNPVGFLSIVRYFLAR